MKRQRLFLFLLLSACLVAGLATLMLAAGPAATRAATAAPEACWMGPHTGAITSDQTWCAIDNPHILSNGVIVAPGVVLTLEPGVLVMVHDDGWAYLAVQGHLEAAGTEAAPIIFTSEADSGPDQWRGITFDGGTGTLRHVTVRNAGRGCYGCQGFQTGAIAAFGVQSGQVTIEDSLVVNASDASNADHGLYVIASRVAVSDTLFQGIGDNPNQDDFPVYITGASSVVSLSGNRFVSNIYDRVLLDPGAMTAHDFTLAAQPVLEGYQLGGAGTGSGFIVPAGITMSVDPGVKVMAGANGSSYLAIQGHLEAAGTEADPIIFTSQWDSGPDQWPGITFDGGTGNLRHAIVRYAGRGCYGCQGFQTGAITAFGVQSGQVTIEASQVISTSDVSNSDHGLYVVNSNVVVSDTLFSGIGSNLAQGESAIYAAGNSTLSLTGSAIEKIPGSGVVVDGAARVRIAGTSIVGNNRHGVEISGDSAVVTMTGSTVLANTQDGVRNNGSAQVTLGGSEGLGNTILGNGGPGADQVGAGAQMNATHNWWGDVTGPYHATLNPEGKGENVSDRVLFDPWAVDWQGDVLTGVFVSLTGPRTAAPGGPASYTAAYVNGRAETVENAVLAVTLPAMAYFRDATRGGAYWARQHAVVWKLGDLEAGDSGTVAAQVQYAWGAPEAMDDAARAQLGGTNLPLGLVDVQPYLDYVPANLLGSTALSEAELAAERLAYPDLDTIYTQAMDDGFLPGGAVRLTLDASEPITQVVLLQPDQTEVMYLRRQGDRVLASTFGPASYAVREAAGGLALDLQSGAEKYWGAWGSSSTPSAAGQAYSDCRFLHLTGSLLKEKLSRLAQVLSSSSCYPCLSGGSCSTCFAALQGTAPLPETVEAIGCLADAAGAAATSQPLLGSNLSPFSASGPSGVQDDPNDVSYECDRTYTEWWHDAPWHFKKYNAPNGVVSDKIYYEPGKCEPGQVCINGLASAGGGCQCPEEKSTAGVDDAARLSGCASGDEEGTSACPRTKVQRPRDPNAKYGLEGDLLAGQTVTYTVTYENEGAGRAYGVYVVDPLDESLDLSTLILYGPGQLIAENRTILWTIGDLGPKGDMDSQGVVSFTVKLLDNLPAGTVIMNEAAVYFPTVGEVTPTNPVVNVVQPLAAVPQQVTTTYLQPVAIKLAGRAPAGTPLSFAVVQGPLNGTLSGAAPNLIYTPAENTTGPDSFTFKVSGGGQESRPAEVQIVVDPAGDTEPPQVRWTYPADAATDVAVSAGAVLSDSLGAAYAPLPFAQFSEGMNAATVTDAAVQMVDGLGHELPVSVSYDGVAHRVVITPREPLKAKTWYTVSLDGGVEDLAGNPMGAETVWSFRTRQGTQIIYLPLLLRKH